MTVVTLARDPVVHTSTNNAETGRDRGADPSACGSVEILRAALETMPHALCMFDAEHRLVYSNQLYGELYGLPRGLLRTGMPLEQVLTYRLQFGSVPIEDRAAYRASILDSVTTNVPSNKLVRFADGRVFEVVHRPTGDGGWVAIHEDISARVRAERELLDTRASLMEARAKAEEAAKEARAAHHLLREAFEAVPEGLVLYDAQDRCVLWNRRYAELCEADFELEAGARFEDVLRANAGRGRVPEAFGREEAWLADRLRRHQLPENSQEVMTADGRWRRIVERRTADGGSIGVRIDITELKRREASFKLLFDANPVPLTVFDRESLRFLAVNDAALTLYGYDRKQMLGMTVFDIRPLRDHAAMAEAVARPDDSALNRLWTHLRADGSEIQVQVYGKELAYDDRPARLCAIVDQTETQRVADELIQTRAFLNSVVETIPVMVFAKDMSDEGRYVLFNRAGEELLERPRDQVLGRTDLEAYGPETAARYARQDRDVLEDGRMRSFETTRVRQDGSLCVTSTKKVAIRDTAGGRPRFILGVSEDITERRDYNRRLAHMAHHDVLTDLPNRALFRDRLSRAAVRAARDGEPFAILWLDLDRFKEVNDAYGHQTGDALLQAVATRLRGTLRPSDTAARLGGDEFAVLQAPIGSPDDAAALALRILDTFATPFEFLGHQVSIGASVGIALSGASEVDPESLLRQADIALYRAKGGGRGTYRVFEPEMDAALQGQRRLAMELRQALEEDQFEVFYQPIVSLADDTITGFEALLRWRHPVRGLLSPSEFIQLAEDTGLIVALGKWVLSRACRDAMAWPAEIRVAVNLSPAQFRPGDLGTIGIAALEASGLPPHRLELEITESVRLVADDANLATLHRLRAAGVKIALDDFGTGYSSLSYLRAFPFDRIKVDRSFVRDLGRSEDCLAIVRAVVGLGSSFGVKTTAEGVETVDQLDRLRAEGCDEIQGYLVGRPLPYDAATRLVQPRDHRQGAEPDRDGLAAPHPMGAGG